MTWRKLPEYAATLRAIPGANSYGVPREKWLKLTKKQKTKIRGAAGRERRKADAAAWKASADRDVALRTEKRRQARINGTAPARDDRAREADRQYKLRQKAKKAISLDPDKIYRQIVKAIPSAYPKHIRDDIAGMVCLQVLEGKASLDNVARLVKEATTKFHRVMETWKTKSIESAIPGTDGLTLGERLGL